MRLLLSCACGGSLALLMGLVGPEIAAAQSYGPGYGPPPGPPYGGPGYGPPPGGGYGPPPGGGYGPPPGGGYGPPGGGYGPPQYGPGPGYGPPPGGQGPPPKKKTKGGVGVGGLIGLRVDYASVDTPMRETTSLGAQLSGFVHSVFSYEFFTGSGGLNLGIGLGTQGLEGGVGGLLNVGGIYHLADEHGPFARIGLRGQYEGDDAYTFSYFEVPTLDVGYQLHFQHFLLDSGLRAGPVLTGQYEAELGERDVGVAPEWGGFVTLFGGPAMLDASFLRVEDDEAMHVGKGRACVAYYVGLCADGSLLFGDVAYPTFGTTFPTPSVDGATTWYVGLSLGLGGVFEDTAAPMK